MTLQEYLDFTETGVDAWDNIYDACVTVDYIEPELTDPYSEFIRILCSKVQANEKISDYAVSASWTDLIKKNFDLFNEFATKYWIFDYKDKNEYIYQWINELHMYCAGNVPESYYPALVEFAKKLVA